MFRETEPGNSIEQTLIDYSDLAARVAEVARVIGCIR